MKCQTKLSLRKVALSTLILLAVGINASAFADTASNLMKQEEDCYNKHEYQKAADAGFSLIALQPNNALAHYYLADALVRLNRIDDALGQYTACTASTTDPKIKSYCERAITDLTPLSHENQSTKNAAVMSEERHTILQRGTEEISFKRRLADQQISKIEQESREKIASVPRYVTDQNGCQIPNPNYDTIIDHIRTRTGEKIDGVNALFEKDRADISNNYHRQAQAVETNHP
jgi:tetratricopeptide (TPR) repeat protein